MDLEKFIFGNAAGTAKYPHDVPKLLNSAATRITIGSITVDERTGNIGETYRFDDRTNTSINALGLPGPGIHAWLDWMVGSRPHIDIKCAHKKLWASISGFSAEEFARMTELLSREIIDGIELNLGCPNVHSKEGRKPIPSYHPDLARDILNAVAASLPHGRRPMIGVKISPVEDGQTLLTLAQVINKSRIVDEVVAVNTLPDQTLKIDGKQALAFRATPDGEVKHVGGVAGVPLKEHGVRVVNFMRTLLLRRIRIIGAGGIFTGQDVRDYVNAGAAGVEIGTAYLQYGPKIFSDILQELA